MRYTLVELVQAAGSSAETIRYYQTLGLLPAPEREGRHAIYQDAHLDRLRLIRSMSRGGLLLFDAHVRNRGGKEADPEAVARGFRELLPIATSLVVHHFQRVLVRRALRRLRKKGENGALAHAVEVAKKTRLGVRFG